MAGEILLPPTGNEIVDVLRGAQLVADTIDDPDIKIAHIKKTVGFLAAGQLLGRQMLVDAATIFAHSPFEMAGDQYLFQGLLFVAKLQVYGYMLDEEIPVDSLTLNFNEPEVFGVAPEDSPSFKLLNFQVPVLAIDRCVLTEAA